MCEPSLGGTLSPRESQDEKRRKKKKPNVKHQNHDRHLSNKNGLKRKKETNGKGLFREGVLRGLVVPSWPADLLGSDKGNGRGKKRERCSNEGQIGSPLN